MKAFIASALPWLLMGLALAVLAANCGAAKQNSAKNGARIATGAGLGLLLGVALNSCGLWDSHALGYALGPLWGMALATLSGRGNTPGEHDSDPG